LPGLDAARGVADSWRARGSLQYFHEAENRHEALHAGESEGWIWLRERILKRAFNCVVQLDMVLFEQIAEGIVELDASLHPVGAGCDLG
jgi:hypothetical protein